MAPVSSGKHMDILQADAAGFFAGAAINGANAYKMEAFTESDQAKSVTLAPLMFVAGDHAKNDISQEWKENLEKEGFQVELHIEGLGEIPEIQDIYLSHIQFLMQHRVRGIMEKKAAYSSQKD